MSERIDHVLEAQQLQSAAREIVKIASYAGQLAPHLAAVIMLDDARLEAQLALVEQQRIANLIALEMATEPRNHESYVLHNAQTDINAKFPDYQLRPDIRAALRL